MECLPLNHYTYCAHSAYDRLFPNAVGRSKGERQSFVGDQIVGYPDASSLSLKRPFDRWQALSLRNLDLCVTIKLASIRPC